MNAQSNLSLQPPPNNDLLPTTITFPGYHFHFFIKEYATSKQRPPANNCNKFRVPTMVVTGLTVYYILFFLYCYRERKKFLLFLKNLNILKKSIFLFPPSSSTFAVAATGAVVLKLNKF